MVAPVWASTGMPALRRIAGFTTMMYAIVAKVVSPAMISRERVLFRSEILKNRLSNWAIRSGWRW
jgi:hypothetical protein